MSKKTKLRKKFVWMSGLVEIRIIDWQDGTPLGYVRFGSKKDLAQRPTVDFHLDPRKAITLAKNILIAAKQAGIKP